MVFVSVHRDFYQDAGEPPEVVATSTACEMASLVYRPDVHLPLQLAGHHLREVQAHMRLHNAAEEGVAVGNVADVHSVPVCHRRLGLIEPRRQDASLCSLQLHCHTNYSSEFTEYQHWLMALRILASLNKCFIYSKNVYISLDILDRTTIFQNNSNSRKLTEVRL